MANVYTLPGGARPNAASPTFLFHKAQQWDRFAKETRQNSRGRVEHLEPFKRVDARLPSLREVAKRAQEVNSERYRAWHDRFARACDALRCEPAIRVETWWRLIAGWSTNPALEIGLTLDHLLGFPYVPGSGVKGLLHRVAEMALLTGDGAIPPAPPELPESPPDELMRSLRRAARVRSLFGSLAAERRQPGDPEPPLERLGQWLRSLEDTRDADGLVPEPWREVEGHLQVLCGATATGGLVTCFDAVPDPRVFSPRRQDQPVLTPDVLTPHGEGDPIPTTFLTVAPGVAFEIRFRLGALPKAEGPPRDDEEAFHRQALAGASREELVEQLREWLLQGLAEEGLGAKTAAGYGYLMAPGTQPAAPAKKSAAAPPEPREEVSPEDAFARRLLPDDLDPTRLGPALDSGIAEGEAAEIEALARRFAERFPETLERWKGRPKKTIRDRLRTLGLAGDEEDQA